MGGTDLRGEKSHGATTAMITTVTTIWIILTVGVHQGSLGLIEGAETQKKKKKKSTHRGKTLIRWCVRDF